MAVAVVTAGRAVAGSRGALFIGSSGDAGAAAPAAAAPARKGAAYIGGGARRRRARAATATAAAGGAALIDRGTAIARHQSGAIAATTAETVAASGAATGVGECRRVKATPRQGDVSSVT